MSAITEIAALEALYGLPSPTSLTKVADHITPLYRAWIAASRFCILSTVGPEGTDASPRGDDGPVVTVPDPHTLMLPDWRGNNRMDSLRNIVRDGRASLMFMVPGSANVVRVNGRAQVQADAATLALFDHGGARPRTVIVFAVAEVYAQCARAIQRAAIWSRPDDSADLPSIGAFLAEAKAGFDGAAYDAEWPGRAAKSMW